MPTTAKTKVRKAQERAAKVKTKGPAAAEPMDAIALLEADHREVDGFFETYEGLAAAEDKKVVASQICLALKVHTQIEEELFYPAARKATGEGDLLDEALVEHMGAKTLVAEIEAMQPGQNLYDAKVKVLGEQVRHHVQEEEEELFPEVRQTQLDLKALGSKMAARKAELLEHLSPPRPA